MKYVIQRGEEPPSLPPVKKGRRLVYPFREMEPGTFIEISDGRRYQQVAQLARRAKAVVPGANFVVEELPPSDEGRPAVFRIWRV
jgi:hypothetical protein